MFVLTDNEPAGPRYHLASTPPPQSTTPGLHPVSIHQMAPLRVRWQTPDYCLLLIYRPRKDERLSWLACSGWLTHISGHPSAAGRAHDRESWPAKDRRHIPLCHATNSCIRKFDPGGRTGVGTEHSRNFKIVQIWLIIYVCVYSTRSLSNTDTIQLTSG